MKEHKAVHSAPDGGYGWVVALCGMAFTALQTSYFSVYGAVYIELVDYYSSDKATISWIGAIQQCMFGVSESLWPQKYENYFGNKFGGHFGRHFGFSILAATEHLIQTISTPRCQNPNIDLPTPCCCINHLPTPSLYLMIGTQGMLSSSSAGWWQRFKFYGGGLLYGPLARRFGGRRVGIFCPFLVAAGYLTSALSSKLSMLFVGYAFLAGIGLGGFGTVSISSVYPWFSRRQPLAVAIVMLGIPVGAFLWPPIVTQLVHVYSWRGAFVIVAGIHLQAVVFFALIRMPPKPKVIELQVNSDDKVSTRKTDDTETEHAAAKKSTFCSWIILFQNPAFPVLFFGLFLLNFGHVVPFTYTTARGILLGYSDTHSAVLASIIGVGSGIGRLLAGIFGSRADGDWRVKACGTGLLLAGFTSIISYSSNNYWFLASYSGIWGFLAGIYAVCSWAIIVDLFGQTYAAEMSGFLLTCAGLAFLCTNVLTGFIIDETGDPSLPFAIFGGVQILASCAIFLSFCLHKRNRDGHINADVNDEIDRVSLASVL
ncbi:hypothetical protein CAPTEDRAFT_228659 [Capitella teleta]|uniref:Major facilitator superfamily (MFS) profile domain-containing protein n=1 Tax=Capitella teleta TaxID=283909 RepID=R7UCS6_CAPTE|nr:hypothetical protein CAPTEDRAFT_228659 [Capitella teleta]|eukprot:ELU03901.1 hypothetical protein CAPTEDRAFT_228659 [Capitella teleta]